MGGNGDAVSEAGTLEAILAVPYRVWNLEYRDHCPYCLREEREGPGHYRDCELERAKAAARARLAAIGR